MISPFLPSLNFFFFSVSFFIIRIGIVGAQSNNNNNSHNPSYPQANNGDSISNFQPSLAVVIGMLSIMFSLTFILLLYAKFCHRASSVHTISHQIQDSLVRSRRTASGLDKTLVESLPFFRFSSLKGSRHGLECAVCLAKFEDVEVLRLLPKCKHAFHIDCIDQWLDKHSTCPLCRHRVTPDDLSRLPFSTSLRHLWTQNDRTSLRQDSGIELYVQREESRHGSCRFSIGGSFRKAEENNECVPIQQSMDADKPCSDQPLHKFNHRIVVSDVVLKNRWSNVSSSDLMFLNSEMLNYISSARFSSLDYRNNIQGKAKGGGEEEITANVDEVMDIKEEMERKRMFESKLKEMRQLSSDDANTNISNSPIIPMGALARIEAMTPAAASSESAGKALLNNKEKRSMSEIIVHPRFHESKNNKDSSSMSSSGKLEERRRRMWLPIARKTVQWFANRERTRTQQQRLSSSNV